MRAVPKWRSARMNMTRLTTNSEEANHPGRAHHRHSRKRCPGKEAKAEIDVSRHQPLSMAMVTGSVAENLAREVVIEAPGDTGTGH